MQRLTLHDIDHLKGFKSLHDFHTQFKDILLRPSHAKEFTRAQMFL